MDAATGVIIVVLGILYGVFSLGQWSVGPDFANQCNDKGEFSVRGVVFKCEPVAAWVNGKKVELKHE